MKETLQIGIPCGRNSERFVEFLINTIDRTVSEEYVIKYIFGINQKGVDEQFLKNITTKYEKKIVVLDLLLGGAGTSNGHGDCLNLIFQTMNSKYGMVIDSDTAFLFKGWDKKLISLLKNGTAIIGTEYGIDQERYMGSPNAIMSLFLVNELRRTGLSWRPRTNKSGSLSALDITDENYQIYGRRPGDRILLDTSCEIPERLHEFGYSGIAMTLVSPRIDKSNS